MVKLREWQKICLDDFVSERNDGKRVFVFEACPGAGKSLMAAELSWQMLNDDENPIDLVVVVVPWKSIQGFHRGDEMGGMIKTFDKRGLRIRERLMIRGSRIVQQPVPTHIDAIITTYAECINEQGIETLELWASKGLRIAMVFDEIHHATSTNGTWGTLAERAAVTSEQIVVMSGTYFRTDGHPIQFVEYKDDGHPRTSTPAYTYSHGVSDRVVRPVACKYTDVELSCIDEVNGRETHSLSSIPQGDRRLGAVMREVFHPEGEMVQRMISDVHDDLMARRRRFHDAACLFTCRPGRNENSEDKHVQQIAQKIRQYTGEDVVIVTHHDRNASGKIQAFRNSRSPYLVAVNMISEGVDIPRIRSVAMMRYITSEMMFRQIVGRALRMTADEDGTAAQVFLPKFDLMYRYGLNLEGESLEGLKTLECEKCNAYPCECICKKCQSIPCVCKKPIVEDVTKGKPGFDVLSQTVMNAGGSVSDRDVEEPVIELAKALMRMHVQHSHANAVQLADALQLGYAMMQSGGKQVQEPESHLQKITKARKRVNRLMQKIAGKKYGGDFKAAWVECLIRRHNADWQTVKNTWSVAQLERLANELEETLTEAYRNGSR
jgi:hypothetical protein